MNVPVNVYCQNCNKEARLMVKLGTSTKELQENHKCPHCGAKGKLTTVRQ